LARSTPLPPVAEPAEPATAGRNEQIIEGLLEALRISGYVKPGTDVVMEEKAPDAAAIASSVAASIYGAHILQRSIEDDRRNFTRFFLLYSSKRTRVPRREAKAWKTSLVFTTRNIPGALFRALSAFALRDLNLTKIESRPLHGKPWEYLFYLDFLDREDEPRVQNALRHLAELADFMRVLGTYPKDS